MPLAEPAPLLPVLTPVPVPVVPEPVPVAAPVVPLDPPVEVLVEKPLVKAPPRERS